MISLRRRQFVLASAAALAQLGLPRAAFPQSQLAKPGAVPAVDSLLIRVLTDSSYDTPRPTTSKWVKVTRAPTNSRTDYRKALHNEWGLALNLESRIGADTRNLLLDFGYTPNALVNASEPSTPHSIRSVRSLLRRTESAFSQVAGGSSPQSACASSSRGFPRPCL